MLRSLDFEQNFKKTLKTIRVCFWVVVFFLSSLLVMASNFDALKNFLFNVLSSRTIDFIRLLMQYSLGTQSVAVALQTLISCSVVLLSTCSAVFVIVGAFYLFLWCLQVLSAAKRKIYQQSANLKTSDYSNILLLYSRLNI